MDPEHFGGVLEWPDPQDVSFVEHYVWRLSFGRGEFAEPGPRSTLVNLGILSWPSEIGSFMKPESHLDFSSTVFRSLPCVLCGAEVVYVGESWNGTGRVDVSGELPAENRTGQTGERCHYFGRRTQAYSKYRDVQ